MNKAKSQVLTKDLQAYLKFQGVKGQDVIIFIKRDGVLVRLGTPTRGLCLEAMMSLYTLMFQNITDKEAEALDTAIKSIFESVKKGLPEDLIGALIRTLIRTGIANATRDNKKEGECADNE